MASTTRYLLRVHVWKRAGVHGSSKQRMLFNTLIHARTSVIIPLASSRITRKRRSLDRRGPAILTFHAAIFVNLSWTIRRRVEANERKKWRKRLPILSKDYLRNVLRFTPLILVTTGTTWPSYDCARQPIDIGRKLTLSQLMHASINPFRLDTSGRVRARSPLLAFFFAFASLSFTWTQDGWALLRIVVEKDWLI